MADLLELYHYILTILQPGTNIEAYAVGMGISASNFRVQGRTGVPLFRHRTDSGIGLFFRSVIRLTGCQTARLSSGTGVTGLDTGDS